MAGGAAERLRVDDRAGLNGSFEARKRGNAPEGWSITRGAATVDRKIAREGKASLRTETRNLADTRVESEPIELTVGRRYEIRGWVRTRDLQVQDPEPSATSSGAAISMASLPFDVHSKSIGGNREWTMLGLRFVATRPEDRIVCQVGSGGQVGGTAWFDEISIQEAPPQGQWPSAAAVQTFGPAYRYPKGGWIFLHIEGAPYERGYQHGYLMAPEIGRYLDRCALKLDPQSKERAWETARTTAGALFLRGYDKEILEEMKGIADGAAAQGVRWAGRPFDLVDVVSINSLTEIELLRAALPVTPTGLEGLGLRPPGYFDPARDVPPTERCSAFAATGPATRDGKIVIGHITMWPLTLSEQTNVMLDLQPAAGQRVLMQSYPAGIQSGMDWYQNDAGIVLTETTIRQGPFNPHGKPEAFRARQAAQYGTTIDEVVERLGAANNGLLSNEWLIADAKTNEIAMFELGTYRGKLYRSSKNEWFGGTPGFYWGCNNAKDLNVRLEYAPDPNGPPTHLPYVPSDRDVKWQELYQENKGRIDEHFAFLAFRTPPLVKPSAFDAKVTTGVMASNLMCWAFFGKPNHRERLPSQWERQNYPHISGIFPSGYWLFQAEHSDELREVFRKREADRLAGRGQAAEPVRPEATYKARLWKGWVLPAEEKDAWLTAGSAAFHAALNRSDWIKALEAHRVRYLEAAVNQDLPIGVAPDGPQTRHWFQLASNKGVLLFDALRREIGDTAFFQLMNGFFTANAAKPASSALFIAEAEKAAGRSLKEFFTRWLDSTGLPDGASGEDAGAYLIASIRNRLRSAVLVYGTTREAGANRYAAEVFQRRCRELEELQVPVLKDFEVTEEDLKFRDVIFVGRPATNGVLAEVIAKIGLIWRGAVFQIKGRNYASENDALVFAAANPFDRSRMMLVLAGNSPLETVRAASAPLEEAEYVILNLGKLLESGF
jgi:hypothetical protein